MNVNIIGNTECIDTGRKDGTHLMRTVGSSISQHHGISRCSIKG